jgi:hypothetical protein
MSERDQDSVGRWSGLQAMEFPGSGFPAGQTCLENQRPSTEPSVALRRGQDFDLWLRLAHRSVAMAYQQVVLAERRVRSNGLSGDSIRELERALNVLERFAHRYLLNAATRTALRIRTMQLVDRLEIEQAKVRILEGNFAAARYHLAAARERPLKLRLVTVAIRIAPKLVRAIYARARGVRLSPALAASTR